MTDPFAALPGAVFDGAALSHLGSPAREQRELERAYAVVRTAYRVLPDRLTYFPLAYHARKHHECLEKMTQRQQKSFAYHLPENAGA